MVLESSHFYLVKYYLLIASAWLGNLLWCSKNIIIYGGQQDWRRTPSGNLNQVKVRKRIAYPESCSTSSTVSGKEIPFVSGKSNTRIPQTAARTPAMGMEEKQNQFFKVLLFYVQGLSDK